MAFNEQQHLDQLTALYRQAFLDTLGVLLKKEDKKQNTVFHKDQLKQIMSILSKLDEDSAAWIQRTIPAVYQANYSEVIAYIQKMGMQKNIRPDFAKVHQGAIDVLAQNMRDNLRGAINFAGRRVNDEFRKAGLEAAAAKTAAGKTVQDMKKDLVERLTSKGLDGFKDGAGRIWKLDVYAKMVARTVTREAASIAKINTCLENDVDLVYITEHIGACEICQPWQGKVYSISGKSDKFPPLTEDIRPPLHPNCRHSLHPYIYELNEGFDDFLKQDYSIKPPKDPIKPLGNTKQTGDKAKTKKENTKEAYKEAKTVKEAEKWANDNLGMENSYTGLDVKLVNELNKTMFNLYGRLPELKGLLQGINQSSKLDYAYAEADIKIENNKRIKPTINLNKDEYKKYNNVKGSYEYDLKENFHPAGTDYNHIVIHEIGHLVELKLLAKQKGYDISKDLTYNELKDVVTGYNKGELSAQIKEMALKNLGVKNGRGKNKFLNELGEYSTKNSKEFFAEAFGDAINSTTPKDISKEVLKIIQDMLKD